MPSNRRPGKVKGVSKHFLEHLIKREEGKPTSKADLRLVYYQEFKAKFLSSFPENHKPKVIGFHKLFRSLTNRNILKVEQDQNDVDDTAGRITYLGKARFSTDQHFGRLKRQGQGKNLVADKSSSQRTDLPSGITEVDKSLKLLLKNLKHNRTTLVSNKNGISISPCEGNGQIDLGVHAESGRSVKMVDIKREEDGKGVVKILKCLLLQSSKFFTIADQLNVSRGKRSYDLNEGETYQFTVYYKSKTIGSHSCPVAFEFEDSAGEVFHIIRFLKGRSTNVDIDELMPLEPYHKSKRVVTVGDPAIEVVFGVPPLDPSSQSAEVKLDTYLIPSSIRSSINQRKKIKESVLSCLEDDLTKENHKDKFHTLLYLEELQQEVDIRRYDMKSVTMDKVNQGFLLLKVPGLAENRPSLIRGDKLYLRRLAGEGKPENKKEYQGYVHYIELDNIKLKFHANFHSSFVKGQKFDVRFTFNRTPLRIQHRALDKGHQMLRDGLLSSLHLPVGQHLDTIFQNERIKKLRDKKVETNEEQLNAVKHIVSGTSRPIPYLIFGPPGTGKTITIVEAMRQILILMPDSRILACAPSNSATDLILHRLLNPNPIAKNKLFRLNALGRSVKSLPEEFGIKKCCCIGKDGREFAIPSKSELMEYRVIVTTLVTAGRLLSMGFPADHFTHIFIDECGQAIEPETLIPLAGIFSTETKNGGQVVLAGDPKQLGPVLRSPMAMEYGLSCSLLERLMTTMPAYQRQQIYEDDSSTDTDDASTDTDDSVDVLNSLVEGDNKYDQNVITKLLKNYRSHPAILELSNELFYDNELLACADEMARESLCQWDKVQNNFPIIFHGVQGQDLREGNSPSFFNPEEASIVGKYVKELLDERKLGIKPAQIGIISPYRRQVEKIRQLLQKEKTRIDMNELKVGSVEEFQGQERRIIIISTVRSNKEYLQLDSEFSLGFLTNPKRFNVAVTRAKALLIVVGNPNVLCKDNCWNRFLIYCQENNAYIGCDFQPPGKNEIDIVDRMKKLRLDKSLPNIDETAANIEEGASSRRDF